MMGDQVMRMMMMMMMMMVMMMMMAMIIYDSEEVYWLVANGFQ